LVAVPQGAWRRIPQPRRIAPTVSPPAGRRNPDPTRLDRIVEQARRERDARAATYRERALKLFPWICGRCAREFDRSTVRQLTVHHKDHNHENNPADGSNWELLCVYCHDNEHARELEAAAGSGAAAPENPVAATHRPFADLAARLKGGRRGGW
jgi:hypothetical protein